MAFETTATVLGAATQYRIAPEAKKYTLRDNGFYRNERRQLPIDSWP